MSATLVVQKFGGSSVADADRIKRVARRIARERAAGNDLVVDEAFAAYARANALVGEQARAENLRYDRGQSERNTAELISIFSNVPPAQSG